MPDSLPLNDKIAKSAGAVRGTGGSIAPACADSAADIALLRPPRRRTGEPTKL
jgi:hypothetical protein